MEIDKTKNKIQWIVSLRAFACIAVVMIHVLTGWFDSVENINISNVRLVIEKNIILPFIKFAVPCFLMISGCLILDPKRRVNIDKIKKYIIKMLCILGIFGFIFCLIENWFSRGEGYNFIYKSILDLFEGKSWDHIWYIYMLIGLYIVTPILRKFIENTDIKSAKFVLILLFILSIVIPTINDIFNIKITTFYLEGIKYIYIYMLGYYLVNTKIIKNKYIYIGGIIGILGNMLISYYCQIRTQENMFIVLESMLIVKLFSDGIVKTNNNKIINCISKYSLGIYLVHAFWLNILTKGFGIYPDVLPCFIGEIVFFIYALVFSIITSMILYKLPIIKNIW